MDVVAPFQFITKIRTVNPSGVIVGHVMDFTTLGNNHHILDFGIGIITAKRILEGFHLLGIIQINFSKKSVNCFTVLPGGTTAATLAV